jgi:hypothetical protein
MITGGFAALIAIWLLRGGNVGEAAIRLWNAFGLLDLVVAVGLAVLSTPGAPFQLFTDVPARPALMSLPWILVPAAIVPALFIVHLAIWTKLAGTREPTAANPIQRASA